MRNISAKTFNRSIVDGEGYSFSITHDGVYLISISASAKNWRQNYRRLFNDDDLAIEVDGAPFYEFTGKRKEFASPASWNGNELKGKSKTNWYILPLPIGEHRLTFVADGAPIVETIDLIDLGTNAGLVEIPTTLEALDVAFKNVVVKRIDTVPVGSVRYVKLRASKGHSLGLVTFDLVSYTLGKRGHIALYHEITDSRFVNLRSTPSDADDSNILAEIQDKSEIEIVEEKVEGVWSQGANVVTSVWHKVKYQEKIGYVLSSFVEIDGQERALVVEKIRAKSKELGMNPGLLLAIAWCESKYKPYAVSALEEINPGKGIFQLTNEKGAREQLATIGFPLPDPFVLDRSIEGGIRYAKWLYETGYQNTANGVNKFLAAWNAGREIFPPRLKLDYGRAPTPKKRAEVIRFVSCVRSQMLTKVWKKVAVSSMVVIALLATVQSSRDLRPAVSHAVSVLETSESTETDREEKISLPVSSGSPVEIAIERLGLDSINGITEEEKTLMGKTYGVWVNNNVFLSSQNTIYFAVSDSYMCGAQNCHWVLFRYDKKRDELRHLPGEIFGTNVTFSPSPQRDFVILESQSAAGACRGSFGLFVLNTGDDTLVEIPFEGDADLSYTESVQWIDNGMVEIVAGFKNCSEERGNTFIKRRYQYHIPR